MTPLVSIVCLCYNHNRFVGEALQSVFDQTYPNIQLIVVDDCSMDGSAATIERILQGRSSIPFLRRNSNTGNCRAFNEGLRMATGKYVIDLAADDILAVNRVEVGVALLESKPEYGVQFSDAEIIDENGKLWGRHSDRFPHVSIPSGDIFVDVMSRYFINSPTMMIRKTVLDTLGGYDESLAYEDFDFWVRSSRRFYYLYTPEVLIKRRSLSTSMGKRQHMKGSNQSRSTRVVCEKAFGLCKQKSEYSALKKRVAYEMRKVLFVGDWKTFWGYWSLWRKI